MSSATGMGETGAEIRFADARVGRTLAFTHEGGDDWGICLAEMDSGSYCVFIWDGNGDSARHLWAALHFREKDDAWAEFRRQRAVWVAAWVAKEGA